MWRYLMWGVTGGVIGALGAILAFPVFQAWVREFQTLIAGLLAVAAAAVTVQRMDATIRTMEKTDQAAERRHQDTRNLMIRADRLKIEVLLTQLINLSFFSDSFRKLAHSRPSDQWTAIDYEDFGKNREQLHGRASELAAMLNETPWIASAGLWGGAVTNHVNILKGMTGELMIAASYAAPISDAELKKVSPSEQQRRKDLRSENLKLAARLANRIPHNIDGLHERLIDLGRQYDIDITKL
ncbi:hypothetical protein AB9E09_03025 [Rhizobium leguminosarum]|uniref:hypothetical protein n=1 Tax=Rhizobium leguminosarum TaxID=384 RepID=UPI003F9D4910